MTSPARVAPRVQYDGRMYQAFRPGSPFVRGWGWSAAAALRDLKLQEARNG